MSQSNYWEPFARKLERAGASVELKRFFEELNKRENELRGKICDELQLLSPTKRRDITYLEGQITGINLLSNLLWGIVTERK